MFTYDDKLKGLPATRDQVVAVYQSINQPHLAIPGKQAGPAHAFIVGLRGPSGFAVFVYLYLPQSRDCAIYAPSRRNLTPEEYQNDENEALSFVESMGFMMDNMNFRSLPPDEQEALLKSLPVFQKDPRSAGGKQDGAQSKQSAIERLGRLLASF